MAMQTSPDGKVDRQTTVPFHLKLFYRTGSQHRPDEFPTSPSHTLPPHLQIYTWPSCTIRELSHLLTSALPSLLPDPIIGTRLSYRLIFPDTRDPNRGGPGRYLTKDLGSIVVGGDGPGARAPAETDGADSPALVSTGPMSGRLEGDPERTLQDARFVIGDYVSCAIFAPGTNGEAAASGGLGGTRGRGGRAMDSERGRENGYGGAGGSYRGGRSGYRSGASSYGRLADPGLPSGEWRRGERIPEGPSGGRGRLGRGRDRGW